MSRLSSGLPGTIAGPESPPEAQALPAVEPEPAPQLLGGARVALAALRRQDGPDLRLEELLLLGRDRRRRRGTALARRVGRFCLRSVRLGGRAAGPLREGLAVFRQREEPVAIRVEPAEHRLDRGRGVLHAGRGAEMSRYSSSESRPSRSASPRMKIRSGSKAGNRCVWAVAWPDEQRGR